ncbi:MAG: class A beta-lactamase-related serine hydrolase [Chitinophagaceae bacterium]|nr:MAG: class A beta-lactamase-related serine hydrolase [Chitinophagaceae bacterium]
MKFLFLIFSIAFTFSSVNAQSIARQADSIMQQHYPDNDPGAALLIEKDGKIIIEKGYGVADLKTNMPVSPSTDFRMASVSKQFTAMGMMLLAARNQLSLNDEISKYFTNLPPALQSITIRQLLTHTSGIWDYEALIPDTQKTQLSDEDALKLVETKDGTYFSPGTKFKYSNTGYCLLALIVQNVSGVPFATFVKENIFDPLGMKNSMEYVKGENIHARAYGYHWNDGQYHFADQSITSATKGDGGVYTSLRDYLKWNNALSENRLLPKVLMDSIFTGYATVKNGVRYGYGWFIGKETDGTACMFHSGESTGFHNIVYRNPQKHLLLVILSNRDDNAIAQAFDKIADLMQVKIDFQEKGDSKKRPSLFHWLSSVYGD